MGTAPGIGDAPAGPPGGGYLPPVRTQGISASNVGQSVAEAFSGPRKETLVAGPPPSEGGTRPDTANLGPESGDLGEGDLSVPVILSSGGPVAPSGPSDGAYKLGDLLEASSPAPVVEDDDDADDEFTLDPATVLKGTDAGPMDSASLAAAAMGRMHGGRR